MAVFISEQHSSRNQVGHFAILIALTRGRELAIQAHSDAFLIRLPVMTKIFDFFSERSTTLISFGVGALIAAVIGEVFERSITWTVSTLIISTAFLIMVSVYSIVNERTRIFSVLDRLDNAVPLLARGNKFESIGIHDFGHDRSRVDFTSMWNTAEGFVKVIGLSANDILSPHTTHLIINRIQADPDFRVQVLIINPWSQIAQRRSEAVAYKTEHEFFRLTWSILLEARDKLDVLHRLGVTGDRFDVRLYDSIPSLSMIIDSRQALVTPLTCVLKGGSSPFFIARATEAPSDVFNTYLRHFDAIWSEPTSVSLHNMDLGSTYSKMVMKELTRAQEVPPTLAEWLEMKTVGQIKSGLS